MNAYSAHLTKGFGSNGGMREPRNGGGSGDRRACAIFIDNDDVLVRDVPSSGSPAHISWVPGALEALGRLQDAGFRLVLATNQPGVARGRFTEDQLRNHLQRMARELTAEGIHLSAALYCPHHPEAMLPEYRTVCDCRKPKPGLLRHAASVLGLDMGASWMIGDLLDDVEAGWRAGCRTVLLDTRADQVPHEWGPRCPDAVLPSLPSAAEHIIAVSSSFAKPLSRPDMLLASQASMDVSARMTGDAMMIAERSGSGTSARL